MTKKISISPGQKFGDLTVLSQTASTKSGKLKYLCKCKCGGFRSPTGSELHTGKAVRCIKCGYKIVSQKLTKTIPLGRRFGSLVVLKVLPTKLHKAQYLCKCGCGTEVALSASRLRFGDTLRCMECSRIIAHAKQRTSIPLGGKYGQLTVISKVTDTPNNYGVRCDCGTFLKATSRDLRLKRVSRCKMCTSQARAENHKKPIKPGTFFGLLEVLSKDTSPTPGKLKVWVRCKCGVEKKILTNHLRSGNTKSCGCFTESYQEKSLFEFVKSITNTQITRNDRKALAGKEIDIFLPALKIGIEYNGNYWHSEVRSPLKTKHFEKRVLAEKHGIRLIQIRSDEWLNKPAIVKSILRNVLGVTENRYFARKLALKKVKPKEAQTFLSNNHLMGAYQNARHIGLYTDDVLVQIFSYQIKKQGKELECSRICSLRDHVIVGGVSRLLKAVLKQHLEIQKVLSFVDLRYADGHSLAKMGFKLDTCHLGWGWVDTHKGTWYNRLRCKANMDSRKLSQKQHAELLGWSRLYDAGQAKWVLDISK